jgi:adenosylcobinamide-GDP ribazoletransferase
VAAVLAVAASVWLTGAFHEDGLADTFDALGGYVPRERALTIMKDSRIGTYGAVALLLGLGLRVGLVASLAMVQPLAAVLALVAAHSMGRTAAVGMMVWLPYAGDAEHAKAKPLALAVPRSHAFVAVVWCVLVWAGLVWAGHAGVAALSASQWGWAVAGSLLVVLSVRRWLQQRLGGYTGDALGATEQLVEMAVLLALASTVGGGS